LKGLVLPIYTEEHDKELMDLIESIFSHVTCCKNFDKKSIIPVIMKNVEKYNMLETKFNKKNALIKDIISVGVN